MFIIHLYPFKAPKNRNFPTLGIPVSYQQKIQLWTQYGDQLGMIVLKKKTQKPIGARPGIAMFMQPMRLFNMHRLFPFEGGGKGGERGFF